MTLSSNESINDAAKALCVHPQTKLTWQPRGIDVWCPGCNAHVFVGRNKLLAYARGLLEQQFNAQEYFHNVFSAAIESGNDVSCTVFTDDARAITVRGLVQSVAEDAADMTVDVRGKGVQFVHIPFRALLQAQEIIPEVEPAGELPVEFLNEEEDTDEGESESPAGEATAAE